MRFQGRNRAEAHLSGSRFPVPPLCGSIWYSCGNLFPLRKQVPFQSQWAFLLQPSPACTLTCAGACSRGSDRQLWVCGLLGATCLKGWRTFQHQLFCSLAQNSGNTPVCNIQVNLIIKHKRSITHFALIKGPWCCTCLFIYFSFGNGMESVQNITWFTLGTARHIIAKLHFKRLLRAIA